MRRVLQRVPGVVPEMLGSPSGMLAMVFLGTCSCMAGWDVFAIHEILHVVASVLMEVVGLALFGVCAALVWLQLQESTMRDRHSQREGRRARVRARLVAVPADVVVDPMRRQELVARVFDRLQEVDDRVDVFLELNVEPIPANRALVEEAEADIRRLALTKHVGEGVMLDPADAAHRNLFSHACWLVPEAWIEVAHRRVLDVTDSGSMALVDPSWCDPSPGPPDDPAGKAVERR